MNNYAWCILLLLLSACSLKKATTTQPISSTILTESLIDSVQAKSISINWFSAKIQGSATSKDQKLPVNANLRIKTDSIIWVSVSALFGIEAFRMLVTPDSVKILNRLNKTYFVGDIQYLADKYNFPLSFYDLQDVLLAKMTLSSESNYLSRQEGENFRIESLSDNLKVGFLLNQNFHALVYELQNDDRSFKAEYLSYIQLNNQLFPKEVHFLASSQSDEIDLKYSYSNIVTNTPKKVHFAIPKSYAPTF
jgi:hypothetical protein